MTIVYLCMCLCACRSQELLVIVSINFRFSFGQEKERARESSWIDSLERTSHCKVVCDENVKEIERDEQRDWTHRLVPKTRHEIILPELMFHRYAQRAAIKKPITAAMTLTTDND